jgi:predicted HicB family RNase H-like nuclease
MDLLKNQKKHSGQFTTKIDEETKRILKELSYRENTSHIKIVKKAIKLYQKATIFDNLF